MAKAKPFSRYNLDASSLELRSESDRGCAVLGASLLDVRLEMLFRSRMLPGAFEALLDTMRPLSSFSAKIATAKALGWISEDAAHDLNVVRQVRNDFAHQEGPAMSFDTDKIAARCRELRCARACLEGYESTKTRKGRNFSVQIVEAWKALVEPPRARFMIAVDFLGQYIDDCNGTQGRYLGPDLLQEVHDLAAGSRVVAKIEVEVAVGTPAERSNSNRSQA